MYREGSFVQTQQLVNFDQGNNSELAMGSDTHNMKIIGQIAHAPTQC
jgi:hypothetical protein